MAKVIRTISYSPKHLVASGVIAYLSIPFMAALFMSVTQEQYIGSIVWFSFICLMPSLHSDWENLFGGERRYTAFLIIVTNVFTALIIVLYNAESSKLFNDIAYPLTYFDGVLYLSIWHRMREHLSDEK